MTRVYAFDPGLGGTGWAEWKDDRRVPTRVGVIAPKRVEQARPLASRCNSISDEVRRVIKKGGGIDESVHVYIEMPQHMPNSRAGIAAQAGSVYVLTFLVGYLAARVWPCQVFEIKPGTWKGQLPKDVVIGRVQRIVGEKECLALGIQTHAWDAVGIGLWAAGLLGD